MWELLTGEEPYADMHCASIIGKNCIPLVLVYQLYFALHREILRILNHLLMSAIFANR